MQGGLFPAQIQSLRATSPVYTIGDVMRHCVCDYNGRTHVEDDAALDEVIKRYRAPALTIKLADHDVEEAVGQAVPCEKNDVRQIVSQCSSRRFRQKVLYSLPVEA